jgi:uncharacterized membrane protein required for colicin V production
VLGVHVLCRPTPFLLQSALFVVDSVKQIDLTPVWVDDALAEINQNPLNKFQDQLDATANNPE